jgi:Ca-activated chloride channel family protein
MDSVPQGEESRSSSPYFFVLGEEPGAEQLPLESTHVEVSVVGIIADVVVRQRYRNRGREPLEAIYLFPASTSAAVHGMKMTIGARVIEAEIEKREEARQIYQEAKEQGQTATLLEQQRPNVFQMSVANILPGDVIEVELLYTELLVPQESEYELVVPAVVGPRYVGSAELVSSQEEDWAANPTSHEGESAPMAFGIDVRIVSGVPISGLGSPSHEIAVRNLGPGEARVSVICDSENADRDFVLRYCLAGRKIESALLTSESENESTFLLMTQPPVLVAPAEVVPREYVFILDVSGSMTGFPLDTSKTVVRDVLNHLRPADSFNILLFAGGSEVLSPRSLRASPVNIAEALAWLERIEGGGGTELLSALQRALALPRNSGTSRIVVVATDGYVTVEKQAFDLVRGALGKANLFALGIGSSVNRSLIEGLARVGQGEPFVVLNEDEAMEQAARLRWSIDSPMLQGISIDFLGFDAYDVEPPAVPDLFAGRPVVLTGKFRGKRGSIRIRGTTSEGPWQHTIDVASAAVETAGSSLPLLWARQRIRSLSDMNMLEPTDSLAKEVCALGLKHHLLTDYTSFVAVDTLVRGGGARTRTVRQPLPMPQGVSDLALGQAASHNATYGSGGLSLVGTGRGGGGIGEGTVLSGLGTMGYGGGGGTGAGYGRGERSMRTKAPSVSTGAATVKGSLSKDVIRRIVHRHMSAFKLCHDKAQQRAPELGGSITIEFVVGARGKVVGAGIFDSTIEDSAMEQCVLGVVKNITFPAPEGGGTVTVRYPLVFQN